MENNTFNMIAAGWSEPFSVTDKGTRTWEQNVALRCLKAADEWQRLGSRKMYFFEKDCSHFRLQLHWLEKHFSARQVLSNLKVFGEKFNFPFGYHILFDTIKIMDLAAKLRRRYFESLIAHGTHEHKKNFRLPSGTAEHDMSLNEAARRVHQLLFEQENQFQEEMQNLINFQPQALEAVGLTRCLSIASLWPPYHNKTEMGETGKYFQLREKQRRRLNSLMHFRA